MTDKQITIDGKECKYWFRPNPDDYRKCSLRGKDDNCDEIKDCFIKELLGKLALKEQECERLKSELSETIGAIDNVRKAKEYYQQECEELKKERDTLSITRNKLLDDLWVAEENLKDYMEHFNKASDELDQLKAEKEKLKKECEIWKTKY